MRTENSVNLAPPAPQVAELMLSWINERLRIEAELKLQQQQAIEIPRRFWKVQAGRLLSLSFGGLCWLAIQVALSS